jgi:hypothetical protein
MQGASGAMASSSIQSSDFFSALHPNVIKMKIAREVLIGIFWRGINSGLLDFGKHIIVVPQLNSDSSG